MSLASLSFAADDGSPDAQAARVDGTAITAEVRSQANDIFSSRCAACHGDQGRGNGPAAANLKPRPIDFHSRKWQKSVTNDRIARAIIYGGKSVGLSAEMAANPDLEDEPVVVAALIARIRGYGK
jgi:mono/diheme cytochrome c family protein